MATVACVQLAVVIAARNEAERIDQQLDALEAERWDGEWEVVVVDNASTDDTAEIVAQRAERWARLRLVRADERGDKAYAVNVAVASSDADSFAFTDADDIVAAGWLAAMADGLAAHDFVTGPVELARLNPTWLVGSRGFSAHDATASFEGLFPFARGNNYGLTRAAWDRLGPIPEAIYPVEDMDLSLRARRLGIELHGVPEAVVHYRYRTRAGELWRQGLAYGEGRCRIARDLVNHGEPRPGRLAGIRSWVWLIVNLHRLATGPGRARWAWVAGNRVGHVRGSIRNRILYL